MTSLSLTAQYRILKGADWSLEVQHEIATESKDDLSALSFWMESTTTGGRKYEAAVFEIQYRKDKTEVIFLTKNSIYYRPHYSAASEVECMTSANLDKLVRQRERSRHYSLLDSYAPIIACQAIPVEVREWLLLNGPDTLGPELKAARKEMYRAAKVKLGYVGHK
jgi:hypothetical protein